MKIFNFMLTITLLLTFSFVFVGCNKSKTKFDNATVYDLYFNLLDKDTFSQEISNQEAKKIISDIIMEKRIGYTILEGYGAFTNESSEVISGQTLIFSNLHTSEKVIEEIIFACKESLNIESVYCEARNVSFNIYGGTVTTAE